MSQLKSPSLLEIPGGSLTNGQRLQRRKFRDLQQDIIQARHRGGIPERAAFASVHIIFPHVPCIPGRAFLFLRPPTKEEITELKLEDANYEFFMAVGVPLPGKNQEKHDAAIDRLISLHNMGLHKKDPFGARWRPAFEAKTTRGKNWAVLPWEVIEPHESLAYIWRTALKGSQRTSAETALKLDRYIHVPTTCDLRPARHPVAR